ncbi:hypothetical protein K435DRAFT_363819 [Dendrothele bispora CBS 962.96]|uniref:Uncharacterized protein n=1 Tax=Dendrothele bispora (strain CBS 962.96) TaxID=1314807 RepID=A0A4S8LCE4_DENBC|nr:hypothetical protein K435DRAFT_363819 [Dendrothele bispora CBS 962.96]
METPIIPSVTAESAAIDTIDDVTTMQKDQETPAGTSTTTVTSIGVAGPLASGTSPATVANEEDAQALRTMFNGAHHPEFNNSVLSNVGGNKNETNIVYHIYGSPTINCSSADLSALRVNSTRSPEIVLQDDTQSQPEHVNHCQYMRAGSTAASISTRVSEENGLTTGVQTGITAPRKVQRAAGACEDLAPSCSSPCTQGKEDQQATSAVDGDQTSKIFRVDITIDRVTVLTVQLTLTELRFSIAFFFLKPRCF